MVTFQELINNRGDEFINRLFTLPVTIYEKLDASQFSFECDENGNFSFYKQDQNTPISKIDITLSQYYNSAIKHFQNLPLEKIKIIPPNWRFCCEYFIDKNPVYISYDSMPKNGLVLINIIDNSENVKKVLDKKEFLEEWADFLDIENPPLIFQGLLSETQKNKIMEFVRTPNNKVKAKFETNSFIRHLLSILNPEKSTSFLRDTDRGLIEGIVFKFGNETEHFTAKIIDPIFYSRKIENKEKKSSLPSDIYWLTLLDVVEYLQGENLSNYKIEGETPDERYLFLICSIFNDFIQKYGNKYKGVDFELPKFMQKEAFKIGLEYVPNKLTSKLIMSEESWQNVFKVILAAFRKRKKGTNQFFTEYVLACFNSIVQEISGLCSSLVNEADDNEIGLLTFDEMKRYGKFFDVTESKETVDSKTREISKKLIGQFKVLADDGQKYERELNKICAVVDTFEIFTNEHLNKIEYIQAKYKHKVVLVNIRTNYNLTQEEVQMRMLNSIEREYTTLIQDVVNVRNGDISEILSVLLSKGYEPENIIVQNKDKDYFEKQKESCDLHGTKISIETLDKDPNYKKLYHYIMNDLWSDFRKHVPIVVLNYFEAFKIS
jgi:hypothetical protein